MSILAHYDKIRNGSLLAGQCPRDCVNYIYQFNVKSKFGLHRLDGIKQAYERAKDEEFDESITSTVVISPEVVPFMQISRRYSMTGIQFACNGCALLGMWFGLSVLTILDEGWKLFSHLTVCAKKLHKKRTSIQPISGAVPENKLISPRLSIQQVLQHIQIMPEVRSLTSSEGNSYARY